ncbi:MAG: O-antigen ligase family protein [Nocardioides sp.]
MPVIAASFFWMSNPIVFVREFDDSVSKTITWTAVALAVTLPWLRLPRVPWPWLAFLALCTTSLLWTIDPASTRDSIMLYATLTALAVVVAANCEPEVVAWGMGLGGVAVVALSIYAFEKTMYGSSYPVYNDEGVIELAFAGVGTNENILAYTLAVSLAAMLALGRPQRLPVLVAWLAVLGVHAYGFYLASSGTGYLATFSILLAAAGVLVWSRLQTVPRRIRLAWAATTAALSVAALLVVTVGLDLELSTVSGRAPFWRATVASTVDQAPLLGSGWGAVWAHPWDLAPPNPVADDIYARAGYPLPHGHNFFVDVLPELGLVGILLTLFMVGYALREARSCGIRAGSPDPVSGRLFLLVLVSLLVSGVSEPMLTVPLGWWSLALVVALGRQGIPTRGGGREALHRPAEQPSDQRPVESRFSSAE